MYIAQQCSTKLAGGCVLYTSDESATQPATNEVEYLWVSQFIQTRESGGCHKHPGKPKQAKQTYTYTQEYETKV